MSYKKGDIVLINFPFTNLLESKKRPVLLIKDESIYSDFLCLQITSNQNQENILKICEDNTLEKLKLKSFVKYDKCFTLSSNIIDKKLTSVTPDFLETLKHTFCKELFA